MSPPLTFWWLVLKSLSLSLLLSRSPSILSADSYYHCFYLLCPSLSLDFWFFFCSNQLLLQAGGDGLDGPICANRFADSRGSPDFRESFQGSWIEPLFLRITHFRVLKIANHRFEAIRANRSHVTKTGFFFCELIRANRFALRVAPIRVANPRAI